MKAGLSAADTAGASAAVVPLLGSREAAVGAPLPNADAAASIVRAVSEWASGSRSGSGPTRVVLCGESAASVHAITSALGSCLAAQAVPAGGVATPLLLARSSGGTLSPGDGPGASAAGAGACPKGTKRRSILSFFKGHEAVGAGAAAPAPSGGGASADVETFRLIAHKHHVLVATGAASGMRHINERVAAADGLVVEDAVQSAQCKRSRTASLGRYRPADVAYDVRMGLLSLRPPRACAGRAAKRIKRD